jgi:multicomponent Na+:H+ antiporter subunit G
MAWVLDTLSWGLLVAGGAFCIVGALGLVRMPDFCTRVHAASLIDTTGAGLMLLGLMLQAGFTLVSVKLVALCLLLLLASPTATHALVAAALHRGIKPLLADDEETPPSKP